jgi:predicted metal-dependent hydrolase
MRKESKPKAISPVATLYLHYAAQNHPIVTTQLAALKNQGWRFFVVEQSRGSCYYHARIITVPLWAYNHKDPEYRIYYLAHEMAHAVVGYDAKHGPRFMDAFISICPAHLLKYEIEYKPRNATRAGIYDL